MPDFINKEQQMEVVCNKKPAKMKDWPSSPYELVSYYNLVGPVKSVLQKAYKFYRKDEAKSFEYDGFNFGKCEQKNCPSPQERFSEKFIAFENKRGNKVLDIALNIVFMLGVEQGRRIERTVQRPFLSMKSALSTYRETNKELRSRLDELEVMLDIKNHHPSASIEEYNLLLAKGLKERRDERLAYIKEELAIDPYKSNFNSPDPVKFPFKNLVKLMEALRNDCSQPRWKEILEDHGWTYDEWMARCQKKKITSLF
jgi:hypothetical protein